MQSILYMFLSHLVSRAGCGIRLYPFLIIAYSSTFQPYTSPSFYRCQNHWEIMERNSGKLDVFYGYVLNFIAYPLISFFYRKSEQKTDCASKLIRWTGWLCTRNSSCLNCILIYRNLEIFSEKHWSLCSFIPVLSTATLFYRDLEIFLRKKQTWSLVSILYHRGTVISFCLFSGLCCDFLFYKNRTYVEYCVACYCVAAGLRILNFGMRRILCRLLLRDWWSTDLKFWNA